MPFAVRQWPVAPDPRGPFYSFAGWNWGQVVSFQWVMSSVDATGDYAFLNDGIVLPSTFDNGNLTRYQSFVPPSPVSEVELNKFGLEIPFGSPSRSIEWDFGIHSPTIPRIVFGGSNHLFPNAIRTYGPFAAFDVLGPVLEIPNGITITPAKWDFALP